MNAFIFLALLAAAIGCSSIYLASPHQRWCRTRWPAKPAWALAIVLLSLSWLAFRHSLQAVTASFAFVTALMLALLVLPHSGALVFRRRGR